MTQAMTETKPKLVTKFADKYGVDPRKMLDTLTATAFRQGNNQEISNEQMMALLIVADQYNLNPFTKEIYAFPDKNKGIVPIVGVDGWSRLINANPAFDGMSFHASDEEEKIDEHHKRCPSWITCRMHRKDRSHPIEVTEYLDEAYRAPFTKNGQVYMGPWQTHTKRFLRHKTMIQCARLAFGFAGIYDQDEAERIIEADVARSAPERPSQPPQAIASRTLDDEQQAELRDLIERAGESEDNLLAQIGVESIADIPFNRFPLITDRLQAQIEEEAQEA